MLKPVLVFYLLCAAGAMALRAQDYTATPVDGPTVKADSLGRKPDFAPLLGFGIYSRIGMPDRLAPIGFESREQRAARFNATVAASVMESVGRNLAPTSPPHLSEAAKVALFVARLFLSNPFGFREGTVPMMSNTNPFVYAVTPGWAPAINPYDPASIPQTVRSEYDFATGTYKMVARPWSEVQADLSKRLSMRTFQNDPVPRVYLTPAERALAP